MKKSIFNTLILLCAVVAMASMIGFLVFLTLNITTSLGLGSFGCKACLGILLVMAIAIIGLTCIKLLWYHIIKPILEA